MEKLLNTNEKDFQLLEMFNKPWYNTVKDKKNKLGFLYKCTFKKNENVICRMIVFERITSYQIESYFQELTKINMVKINAYIVPILGYNIKGTNVKIFQPKMTSLYELLHAPEKAETRKTITFKVK